VPGRIPVAGLFAFDAREINLVKSLALCLLSLCLYAAPAYPQRFLAQDDIESYTKVGQNMPAFTVTDMSGAQINTSELKGKVVLINFWATWCPPCLVELPRLENEVWQKYRGTDFVMLAIAREQSDEEIAAFRKEYGFSFPMASDPQREVYKLFGNGGIPRSYVVGADGKILFQSVGYIAAEFDQMKKMIEKELAKMQKAKASK
jgi:peroxiredoxin